MATNAATLRARLTRLYSGLHRRGLDVYRAASLLAASRGGNGPPPECNSLVALLNSVGEQVPLASGEFNGQFNVGVPDVPRLLLAGFEICRRNGWTCHVLSKSAPDPVAMTPANRFMTAARQRRAASFQLIAADAQRRIHSNNLVQTWWRSDDAWVSRDARAGFGRIPDLYELLDGIRTDISVSFPIDAVFTWVDRNDRKWQELAKPFGPSEALDPERHNAYGELTAALRAVDLFAPWIRTIYILSNCDPPPWFRPTSRHVWVDHADVIDRAYLPSFNSHAIETFLHRIPSLAEHFIYLNDDFIVFQPVDPEYFFAPNGTPISHLDAHPSLLPYYAASERGAAADTWAQAGVNGARLILERFGYLPARFHQHVPYAFTRELFAHIERDYADEMHRVRSSRFRSATDISFASFFFHHYAEALGKGRSANANYEYVDHRRYKGFVDRLAAGRRPQFVCLNDAAGSADDAGYMAFKAGFADRFFPLRAACEREAEDA